MMTKMPPTLASFNDDEPVKDCWIRETNGKEKITDSIQRYRSDIDTNEKLV
jgi:hypothetical protein